MTYEQSIVAISISQNLNGRQYRNENVEEFNDLAKQNNLVIVFGASDDLMEFRGAINDEFDCYGGGTAYITKLGPIEECECDCIYYQDAKKNAIPIEAIAGEGEYFWTYKTDLPHETFEIFEDDEKYCKGIIFCKDDIK